MRKHEGFWTYHPATPTPAAPEGWTTEEWEKFTPGMRREIAREMAKRPTPAK